MEVYEYILVHEVIVLDHVLKPLFEVYMPLMPELLTFRAVFYTRAVKAGDARSCSISGAIFPV